MISLKVNGKLYDDDNIKKANRLIIDIKRAETDSRGNFYNDIDIICESSYGNKVLNRVRARNSRIRIDIDCDIYKLSSSLDTMVVGDCGKVKANRVYCDGKILKSSKQATYISAFRVVNIPSTISGMVDKIIHNSVAKQSEILARSALVGATQNEFKELKLNKKDYVIKVEGNQISDVIILGDIRELVAPIVHGNIAVCEVGKSEDSDGTLYMKGNLVEVIANSVVVSYR